MFRAMLVAACTIAAVVGCSVSVSSGDPEISKRDLEQGIADALEKSVGQRPDDVACPGPVKAKTGESTRCELRVDNVHYGLTATITSYGDGKARYEVKVDDKPTN